MNLAAAVVVALGTLAGGPVADGPAVSLCLEPHHPWRPPFGLELVGQPIVAVVSAQAKGAYVVTALREGKEVALRAVDLAPASPVRLSFEGDPDTLVVASRGRPGELARLAVPGAKFEAEAVVRPDKVVNPVDLGTILVPHGWLLLGPGQSATLDVAALSRDRDRPRVTLRAWFASPPGRAATLTLGLRAGVRTERLLRLAGAATGPARDVLHVTLDDAGAELWRKAIPVMRVAAPPRRPAFGATSEHLRYDAPISVRDPKTGTFSTIPYESGWPPELNDVVVSLPNGARFVFWRGSSYIPFWVGRHNTGACYEWAEIISRLPGVVDCIEPLMDKELRYGRVAIVESTPARVVVRWRYQSTDLQYKVWGDEAVEDYVFYPDGFGTRVVTLKSDPKTDYELSEFIVLTPADTYPFSVLPENLVDALFLDGRTHTFRFPPPATGRVLPAEGVPAIYRLRFHKDEALSAIYFNPNETKLPPAIFEPFFDAGQMVTPCYWGSHWPLARGNATGYAINDRVHITPCHNSVMSWAGQKPVPLNTSEVATLDTLGHSRRMLVRRWVWLVGMTGDGDARLRARARSFATPPSLEASGARLAFDTYVPERRALRVVAEGRRIGLTIRPGPPCVNPVFEIDAAPGGPLAVTLDGRPLDPARFAWDGHTLWLDATLEHESRLQLDFPSAPPQ
jgi:hypothetical protein